MSVKPISPLRARMVEDMTVRHFVPDTQREYIRAVKKLAAFLKRSPDTATAEELRAFQVHLTETGTPPPTMNATVTALRFFFKVTVGKLEVTRHLAFVYEPRKLPRVLPPDDVLRLLETARSAKSKAMLSVAYGAGLRAMEVVALKVWLAAGIERALPVLGERGAHAAIRRQSSCPRARSAKCPLTAECIVAVTRTIPRTCPKSQSP